MRFALLVLFGREPLLDFTLLAPPREGGGRGLVGISDMVDLAVKNHVKTVVGGKTVIFRARRAFNPPVLAGRVEQGGWFTPIVYGYKCWYFMTFEERRKNEDLRAYIPPTSKSWTLSMHATKQLICVCTFRLYISTDFE